MVCDNYASHNNAQIKIWLARASDIQTWIGTWNTNTLPCTWTNTAEKILATLADYLHRIRNADTNQSSD
ncbi:hypothetical protein GCM10010464_27100 [Pseudonocardia yunnanensis]|uniref:Tc1-like transposase DDE domain-containing protein n=1 Tax=Pseudonocardia yunnanensis TaxID=58107 RepID=A0ABW4F3R9_9PSEU